MRNWIKATAIRVIKTMAQTGIATMGVGSTIGDVKWSMVLSTSALSGILCVLTCLCSLDNITICSLDEKTK